VNPATGGAAQATKGACKSELENVRAIVRSRTLARRRGSRQPLQSATRQRRLQPRLEPGRNGERNEKV
jgi:hypothetical protein